MNRHFARYFSNAFRREDSPDIKNHATSIRHSLPSASFPALIGKYPHGTPTIQQARTFVRVDFAL